MIKRLAQRKRPLPGRHQPLPPPNFLQLPKIRRKKFMITRRPAKRGRPTLKIRRIFYEHRLYFGLLFVFVVFGTRTSNIYRHKITRP